MRDWLWQVVVGFLAGILGAFLGLLIYSRVYSPPRIYTFDLVSLLAREQRRALLSGRKFTDQDLQEFLQQIQEDLARRKGIILVKGVVISGGDGDITEDVERSLRHDR